MFTGENKKKFEEWFCLNYAKSGVYSSKPYWRRFNALPFEMQVGVYIAYADSLGTYIDIESDFFNDIDEFKFLFHINNNEVWMSSTNEGYPLYATRPEAQRAALKAFDELINNTIPKNEK